ncbi:endonuclease domain-containing protein [Streptomyces sp. NPDC047123]|uniref:endonuclease domain-containing protein n=1 Tax=unclassified Streptomyces TaxID=2593676 RepID=UPI0033DFF378
MVERKVQRVPEGGEVKCCPRSRQAGPRAVLAHDRARRIHVDHRRGPGKVPGRTCFNCNSAIGTLGDDPDTVRRAAAYLEGTSWKPILVAQGVCRQPS